MSAVGVHSLKQSNLQLQRLQLTTQQIAHKPNHTAPSVQFNSSKTATRCVHNLPIVVVIRIEHSPEWQYRERKK